MVSSKKSLRSKPKPTKPRPSELNQSEPKQNGPIQNEVRQSKSKHKSTFGPETAVSGHPLEIQLQTFLSQQLNPGAKILLALSGGLDSCVLLHLLVAAQKNLTFELQALHVHHGLSPNADQWSDFCTHLGQQLNVSVQTVRLNIDKQTGKGIEAEARTLRYAALFNHVVDGIKPDYVITAHHQDDQAETFLLQLFRGAGLKGLSAMAQVDVNKRLLRPLLHTSRQELESYAKTHEIMWCNDESNANTYYERNFVRHEVMPVLAQRNPAVKATIARAASHMAEASQLLDDLAIIDIKPLLQSNSLCLKGLQALGYARAKNGLRWWLSQNQLSMPNAEHLNELLDQLFTAKPDADIHVKIQHLNLKRYQNRAYLISPDLLDYANQSFDLVWNGEDHINLPNGAVLAFIEVFGAGLALKHGFTRLRITNRKGGERFKPDLARPTRTLKHLLQQAEIPPWLREQLPLVYWQDDLVYVPDVGPVAGLKAEKGEPGLVIEWRPG